MKPSLVVNSSPLIALAAALPDFEALGALVERFIVPGEVLVELAAGGHKDETAAKVEVASWCEVRPLLAQVRDPLLEGLGPGEAAVIRTATAEGLPTVVIDETRGRRIARLAGLNVIGSLGLLVELHRAGFITSVSDSIRAMQEKGIHLAPHLILLTLQAAGELADEEQSPE